jgi:MOSC domain-containing protein YiiM
VPLTPYRKERKTTVNQAIEIDSNSVGDPARHLALEDLKRGLQALTSIPREAGRVVLIVRKREGGVRETLDRIVVTPELGIPGDAWSRRAEPDREMQLAVMQTDVAKLIANGQPLTLFGDNLIVELDLSASSLPAGSRVRVGDATLEVTPMPHNGCRKFRARFGDDALRFVSAPELRQRNLRGIYMRVVGAGEVATGVPIEVISRAAATPTLR